MRTTSLAWLTLATVLWAPAGCGGDDTEETTPVEDDPVPQLPDPICRAGNRWVPGTVAFAEATEAWALTGVQGTRLSTVDFDGDGWPDLIVRRASDAPDQSFEPPACCATSDCPEGTSCPVRRVFLMRNTGAGTFEDVTHSSGILTNRVETDATLGRPGQVYAFGDVDNDGDLDVFTGRGDSPDNPQVETSEIMLNQGDGTFALGPADSHLRIPSGDSTSGAAFLDYDRNGLLDLWTSQGSWDGSQRNDHIYWGDGLGAFGEVTEPLGMITQPWSDFTVLNQGQAHTVGWSALACDLNGDGNAELLSSCYGRGPNHLWQATGPDGQFVFVNRSVDSGYAFDHRVDWSDNESARCHCQLHPTDEDCAGVPAPQYIACNSDSDAFRWSHQYDREPFRLGGNSGSTICADVDNDGDMDLLTTEIVHWDVGTSSDPSELLFNTGEPDVRFDRPGNEVTGLTRTHSMVSWNDGDMSGAIFDFDNDGWPDVYIGSSDYEGAKGLLYHQVAPGAFEAVPFAEGIDHNRSHGIAVADFDRDGDLDVVVGHSRARCSGTTDCYPTRQARFFQNLTAPNGNWLQVRLTGGLGTNMAAIGARVTVVGEDGVTQTQEVGGGHGHYGAQHDLTLHFGLGAACRANVTIRWPDALLTEETHEMVAGYRFHVTQGEPLEVVIPGEE